MYRVFRMDSKRVKGVAYARAQQVKISRYLLLTLLLWIAFFVIVVGYMLEISLPFGLSLV